MTEQAAEGGRIPVPADDPGVLAAMVVGSAVNDIRKAVAERVGLTGDEPMNVVLARLDEALAERSYAGPPEGSELVDSPTLAQLREDAEQGRKIGRNALLAKAINEGRMRPADRADWEQALDANYASAARLIKALPVVIPVKAKGYSTDADRDEGQDLLRDIFGGS